MTKPSLMEILTNAPIRRYNDLTSKGCTISARDFVAKSISSSIADRSLHKLVDIHNYISSIVKDAEIHAINGSYDKTKHIDYLHRVECSTFEETPLYKRFHSPNRKGLVLNDLLDESVAMQVAIEIRMVVINGFEQEIKNFKLDCFAQYPNIVLEPINPILSYVNRSTDNEGLISATKALTYNPTHEMKCKIIPHFQHRLKYQKDMSKVDEIYLEISRYLVDKKSLVREHASKKEDAVAKKITDYFVECFSKCKDIETFNKSMNYISAYMAKMPNGIRSQVKLSSLLGRYIEDVGQFNFLLLYERFGSNLLKISRVMNAMLNIIEDASFYKRVDKCVDILMQLGGSCDPALVQKVLDKLGIDLRQAQDAVIDAIVSKYNREEDSVKDTVLLLLENIMQILAPDPACHGNIIAVYGELGHGIDFFCQTKIYLSIALEILAHNIKYTDDDSECCQIGFIYMFEKHPDIFSKLMMVPWQDLHSVLLYEEVGWSSNIMGMLLKYENKGALFCSIIESCNSDTLIAIANSVFVERGGLQIRMCSKVDDPEFSLAILQRVEQLKCLNKVQDVASYIISAFAIDQEFALHCAITAEKKLAPVLMGCLNKGVMIGKYIFSREFEDGNKLLLIMQDELSPEVFGSFDDLYGRKDEESSEEGAFTSDDIYYVPEKGRMRKYKSVENLTICGEKDDSAIDLREFLGAAPAHLQGEDAF